jgi:CBS domain-containing protein
MVDGHYLNLPVVENDGRLVGIVDVLKLTYATLEQVSLISNSMGKTADPRSTR